MKAPFADFIEVLKNMTPAYKKTLIDNFKKFGTLRTYCEAKGYIKTLPMLKGIEVLKKTKEVKELKKVIDILKPGKFQWIEKGGGKNEK